MAVKIVVLYPYPKDIEAFEKAYMNEHVPLVIEKVIGMTKFVVSRAIWTPEDTPPQFYLMAELYFPSNEVLQSAFTPQVTMETAEHAKSISSGGAFIKMVFNEETITS